MEDKKNIKKLLKLEIQKKYGSLRKYAEHIRTDEQNLNNKLRAQSDLFLDELKRNGIDVDMIIKNSQVANKKAGDMDNSTNIGVNNEELIKLKAESEFLRRENEGLRKQLADCQNMNMELLKKIK